MKKQKINTTLPYTTLKRYDVLCQKLKAETLDPEGHQELLELTALVERANVERLAHLLEWAKLRGQTLDEVITSLSIKK